MTEPELHAWRRGARARLLADRVALPPEVHRERSGLILGHLRQIYRPVPGEVAAGYQPMRGEPDPRPFLLETGCMVALPVVQGPGLPLLFRLWTPETPMEAGVFGTEHPVNTPEVEPDTLLIPLVGFDAARYRLGYGGGFYDRTLQAAAKKPRTIGLGFELGRLPTIYPQPHDVPLDAIVTESECF